VCCYCEPRNKQADFRLHKSVNSARMVMSMSKPGERVILNVTQLHNDRFKSRRTGCLFRCLTDLNKRMSLCLVFVIQGHMFVLVKGSVPAEYLMPENIRTVLSSLLGPK
jgi:hypothetical protein